ncbi:MAG: trypsin-like peptidase domain-containing protein [Acidiferrobacterales bacterium]|nr:trypsin-like peptidase domain-containing protein [Acidiferrobacterales bacterium]
MFGEAVAKALQYTRPMVISACTESGECSSTIGTYVVLNNEGWILTAGHLMEIIRQQHQAVQLHAGYRDNVIQFERDVTADKRYRKKGVRTFQKPSASNLRHHSVWWGEDGLRLVEARILLPADLAIGRLEPISPDTFTHYPMLKNPDNHYLPGTMLCKLGFPLHAITPEFDPTDNTFTLPAGSVPLPAFPLEGIFTRVIQSSLPSGNNEKSGTFIETSTPSLIGMMGGPVFDTNAAIWGIQSHTMHHGLDFQTVVRSRSSKIHTQQFLNTGLAVHATAIRDFLNAHSINYQTETSQDSI